MRIVNPNLYPKDGFCFKESDGTMIRGGTWAGVIARTRVYRKRAGLPPGDPEAEVYAQACAKNPGLCVNGDPPKKSIPIKTRVLMWLNGMRQQKGVEFVSDSVSSRRATICARCPNNKEHTGGCSTCRAALKELREAVVKGRALDGRLHGCEVLGEDVAVSIYLELQTVDDGSLPAECWRKRTL